MSCSCNSSPCRCLSCDPEHEPLASALNNFITEFFGTLTKTCVNGEVSWVLPCDLDVGVPGFPRQEGEGLACYFARYMATQNVGFTGNVQVVESVEFNNPNLIYKFRTWHYENGILKYTSPSVADGDAPAEQNIVTLIC